MKKTNKKQGFSLIEVMLGLILLAFFLTISIPVLNKKNTLDNSQNVLSYECSEISPDCMACREKKCIACSNSCPLGKYLKVEDCSCEKCPLNCEVCTKDGCKNCSSGYKLLNLKCVNENSTSQNDIQTNIINNSQSKHNSSNAIQKTTDLNSNMENNVKVNDKSNLNNNYIQDKTSQNKNNQNIDLSTYGLGTQELPKEDIKKLEDLINQLDSLTKDNY